jgi:electron transfer flavoprotein alpha/beta subunit
MGAKKKEIPVITLQDLDLQSEEIAPQMEMVKMESPPTRQTGQIIEDEPEVAAKKLVEFLRQDAKVI